MSAASRRPMRTLWGRAGGGRGGVDWGGSVSFRLPMDDSSTRGTAMSGRPRGRSRPAWHGLRGRCRTRWLALPGGPRRDRSGAVAAMTGRRRPRSVLRRDARRSRAAGAANRAPMKGTAGTRSDAVLARRGLELALQVGGSCADLSRAVVLEATPGRGLVAVAWPGRGGYLSPPTVGASTGMCRPAALGSSAVRLGWPREGPARARDPVTAAAGFRRSPAYPALHCMPAATPPVSRGR